MSTRANALRSQVETALAGRVASPFEYRERPVETVPAGVPEIDRLTGGLPRGALTEICGPAASGRTSVLMAAMAARMEAAEVCALVDARDAFDPQSAAEAGVRLGQLLWVRCRNVDQALRATDLLIQGGGFGLIALDLGDTPARVARAIPLSVWFRMRRAVENTPTILVALEQEPNAKTCASLVLRMEARKARWVQASKIVCDDGFDEEFAPSDEEKIPTLTNRAWGTRKIFCGETSCEQFENPLRSETEYVAPGDALRKTPPSKIEGGTPAKPTLVSLASTESGAGERDGQIVLPYAQGCLFEGTRNYAEVMRSKAKREGDRLTWREETTEGTEFETRAR
jgi:recombination protein RecA